jgi:hypothetical protein
MHDLKWSTAEKRIARRAFERALEREVTALIEEAKKRATRLSTPNDLWALERWLTDRHEEVRETFDFRYSVLPVVFAKLFDRRLLTEHDVEELSREKVELIRRTAEIMGR